MTAARLGARAQGYLAEVGYVQGYYPGLNPLGMRFTLLAAGLRPPKVESACELGFGQGVSLAIHAVQGGTRWYGTDINSDHAAFARRLAGDAAEIHAESFAEFERRDLPDFDFIGLHGVWSWISADNRALITRFIRRRLKRGGVAYLGYNALPGWAAFEPVRHLMRAHAGEPADEDDARRRIADAMRFVQELLATRPDFTLEHPEPGRRFADLQGKDWRYLAHEFFNRDWQAMHFADAAKALAPAGLRFAASADPLDAIEALAHASAIGARARQK